MGYNREFKGVWIPKEVWITRELSVMEKLFFVEIDSLDGDEGCFASNARFAEFFGISKNRCSEIIGSLAKKNMINIEMIREGRQIKKRIIRIKKGAKDSLSEGIRKTDLGDRKTDLGDRKTDLGDRKTEEGWSENSEESNTYFSNTISNKEIDQNEFDPPKNDPDEIDSLFEKFWKAGMRKVGKKKSKPLFRKIVKKQKLPATEFTDQLITDVRSRIANLQMGFTEMHPTTYLNGERWEDELQIHMTNEVGQNEINNRNSYKPRPSLIERVEENSRREIEAIEAEESRIKAMVQADRDIRQQTEITERGEYASGMDINDR